MARRTRIRSVSDIKSSSAVSTPNTSVHKIYMRIGAMEMERERRLKERDICLERATQCQARAEQLSAEIERLLSQTGRAGSSSAPMVPAPELKPGAVRPQQDPRYSY